MAEATSYLDFAEDDYLFFKQAYESGNRRSALAALGQNICERYLKHVVSEYAEPENTVEEAQKINILRTHSLRKLMQYISNDMSVEIPPDTEMKLSLIDGFYFTTRYPGDDSYLASARDIDKAYGAVNAARDFTLDLCHQYTLEQQENIGEYNYYDYDEEER